MQRISRKYLIISLFILGCLAIVAKSWASLSYVKSNENAMDFIGNGHVINSVNHSNQSRARAPEPSTLILFGGGLAGMMISFLRKIYTTIKRIFDISFGIAGLFILSPVMILSAILVKLTSRGPVFYSQIRVGKDCKLFNMFKFRSMKVNAEEGTGPVWAAQNDSRLTPIGGFLRKTHIDELPQLINILKGEMSLIGPRPERPAFVEKFKLVIPNYEKRLSIKPGITGLAQVWHRYDETMEDVKKKLKYDLLYVKRMCLWADVSILMRTFRVVLTGEGAR